MTQATQSVEIPPVITRTTCRVCDSFCLVDLFSLGEQYVSDFVDSEHIHTGIKAPLDLVLCQCCSLVQLRHTAPQELLYRKHYHYISGVTRTMRDALRDVTAAIEERVPLNLGDVVVDIGSNDGTLLRSYSAPGVVRVGVEPALNLAEQGRQGVDVFINDFWDAGKYLARLGGQKAKVISACGMLYDSETPNLFIADVARALAPDGVFVAQLMCLRNMLNVNDIGNLVHEHLLYFSLLSFNILLARHGLAIFDLETNAVNGESYRFYIKHQDALTVNDMRWRHETLHALVAKEEADGLATVGYYREWFARLEENKRRCVDFIREEKALGKRIWLLAASTKGNTVLQYFGLDSSLIDGASERSPGKWGKYTIGTGIPIFSEAGTRREKPDLMIVMPYAFIDEIVAREREWLEAGGRFVVPLPRFHVIGKESIAPVEAIV